MVNKELEIEKQKRLKKKLGRCYNCKFLNYNYKKEGISQQYCHVREERMNKDYLWDLIVMKFCSHFKAVK